MSKSIRDRIKQFVEVKPNGCWIWTGDLYKDGYGRIFAHGKNVRVHRAAYEEFKGPIPEGYVVDHLCHNDSDCPGGVGCLHRRCCNPSHLEAVTIKENTLRGKGITGRVNTTDKTKERVKSLEGLKIGRKNE